MIDINEKNLIVTIKKHEEFMKKSKFYFIIFIFSLFLFILPKLIGGHVSHSMYSFLIALILAIYGILSWVYYFFAAVMLKSATDMVRRYVSIIKTNQNHSVKSIADTLNQPFSRVKTKFDIMVSNHLIDNLSVYEVKKNTVIEKKIEETRVPTIERVKDVEVKALICPQCGASVIYNEVGLAKCSYCGSDVMFITKYE